MMPFIALSFANAFFLMAGMATARNMKLVALAFAIGLALEVTAYLLLTRAQMAPIIVPIEIETFYI